MTRDSRRREREGERGEMCRGNGLRGGGVRCVRAIEINTRRQAEMCVEREIKRKREGRERGRGHSKNEFKKREIGRQTAGVAAEEQ